MRQCPDVNVCNYNASVRGHVKGLRSRPHVRLHISHLLPLIRIARLEKIAQQHSN